MNRQPVPGIQDRIVMLMAAGMGFPTPCRVHHTTVCWHLQDGNVIKGNGKPEATAFWIHSRLHDLRPNTGAVFHTHQPEITALACLDNFE